MGSLIAEKREGESTRWYNAVIARTYRRKPRGSSARSRSGAGARRYRRGSFPSSTLDTSRTRHAGVAPGGRLAAVTRVGSAPPASTAAALRSRPVRSGEAASRRPRREIDAYSTCGRVKLIGKVDPTNSNSPAPQPSAGPLPGRCAGAARPAAPATAAPQASMRLHGTPDVARNRAQAGVQA